MGDFKCRGAFVTGGGSGIGAACVRQLAAAGASVAVADRDRDAAQRVADEVNGLALEVDVTDAAEVAAAVAETEVAFGGLHLAVNNAGVSGPMSPIDQLDLAAWREVLAVNLDGVFHGLRAELPALRRAGGGAIVNVASMMGVIAAPLQSAYVASKHAVVGLTKSAALEGAPDGIRVNAVAPGFVETALLDVVDDRLRAALPKWAPLGRVATADEVASLIVFLLSDAAAFATAAVYPVDGGVTAQ